MTATERRACLLERFGAEGRTKLEPPSKAYLFIVSAVAAVFLAAFGGVFAAWSQQGVFDTSEPTYRNFGEHGCLHVQGFIFSEGK